MKALRHLFLLGSLSCFVAFPRGNEAAKRLDPQVTKHYDAACAAFTAHQYHRALAEIDLVLLPKTKIFIDAPQSSEQYRGALAGIGVWSEALGEDSPFQLADKKDDAQITIEFPANCAGDGKEICGHVEWRRRAQFGDTTHTATVTAQIEIGLSTPDGYKHDCNSFTHVMAHELGHVLGLDDSDSMNDIMGPDLHGKTSVKLGDAEMQAVKELRARCHGLEDSVKNSSPR